MKGQIHFIVHLPLDSSENILLKSPFNQQAVSWFGTPGPLNLTPKGGCCHCQNGQSQRSHGYMGPELSSGLIFPQTGEEPEAWEVDSSPTVHSWLVAGVRLESEILNSYFLAFICYTSLYSVPLWKTQPLSCVNTSNHYVPTLLFALINGVDHI